MTLVVSVKYNTVPGGYAGNCTSVRIESASERVSDVKAIIQGRYPHWHNLQITGVKRA